MALDDAARVGAIGRASVPRDGSWKREVDGLPSQEEPVRLAKQLHMLARCLLALGLGGAQARHPRVVVRVVGNVPRIVVLLETTDAVLAL